MQFGKSIRIYLKDGIVTGVKFGEVVNQTIQCISCPRLRVSELNLYPESKRPGVYFLFGQDEETDEPKVYIVEAENVYDRLQNHVANKDFWNEVIFFVSKDDNLTKSHVKYLESRLIQTALVIKRYKIENFNQSQLSSLPLADRDAMEEFLTYIKLLIGVFGHKILEEVIRNEGLFIAKLNGKIIAYAFAASWEFFSQWPIFEYMISLFPRYRFRDFDLNPITSFQYGPVCIHKDFRGKGLILLLFEFMRSNVVKKYPLSLTFINKKNIPSTKAHVDKLKWTIIDEFSFNNNEYFILAYDMNIAINES